MAKRGLCEAAKKRVKAGRMLLAGQGCAEVALTVGVAQQTVYTWKRLLDEGGIDALRGVPERGRPAQLDAEQLASVRAALLQSPTDHGFGTELWTLKRVGFVIERLHRVRLGQTNVWRIQGSLGLSPPKPDTRAIERNEEAVRAWKRSTWSTAKNNPARRSSNCLRRRVRDQRPTYPGSHLGTQGPDTRNTGPIQLESCLGNSRADTNQLLVPLARRQHQERRDRRVPEGTQGPSHPLCAGAPGRLGRAHPNCIPAALRARHQSGGVSVGQVQTPCLGELLPHKLERVAHHCTKQAQERTDATLYHRRLLDAGYFVVMS
jgi:transposase